MCVSLCVSGHAHLQLLVLSYIHTQQKIKNIIPLSHQSLHLNYKSTNSYSCNLKNNPHLFLKTQSVVSYCTSTSVVAFNIAATVITVVFYDAFLHANVVVILVNNVFFFNQYQCYTT